MDDLISRQAAIEAIKRNIWDPQVAKDGIDAISNLPSAQKHGKRKNKQMYDEELNPTIAFRHRCSECGFEICTTDETIWWHFCPNCGADMRT